MKRFLIFSILLFSVSFIFAQGAWKLVGYKFVDGTSSSEKPLMGTADYMIDAIKFIGGKGSIQITKNRNDKSSGKLLAGVTYKVEWTDPADIVVVGEKMKIQYTLKSISTFASWTPEAQSVYFEQGYPGNFLRNPAGENYFKKDFSAAIVSEKPIVKGTKNNEQKKFIVNLGCGFKAEYVYEWLPDYTAGTYINTTSQAVGGNQPGWYFVKYEFIDGSSSSVKPLAGTVDYMVDASKFTGSKGNIQITKNRNDQSSGKLLAGTTYNVTWTDPQAYLAAGGSFKMKYTLKTISTFASWTPEAQSVFFEQGYPGNFLRNPAGENYFKKDFSADIVSEKPIVKGTKDKEMKKLTVNLGCGFKAVYYYEWRD